MRIREWVKSHLYESKLKEGQGAKENAILFLCGVSTGFDKGLRRRKKQFVYPKQVLDLIRSLLPKKVMEEIRKDAENVSLE